MNEFDPESCFVFTSSRLKLVPREPDEYLVWNDSRLKTYEEEGDDEPRRLVAEAKWCTICLSSAADDGESIEDVVDAHSGDLLEALGAIFDFASGDFKSDAIDFAVWGDVLYFQSIKVKRGNPPRLVANELIDHILRFHGGRSAAAVFIFGKGDAAFAREAFRDRGFVVVKHGKSYEILAIDLGAKRPPLPPAPEDLKKVTALRRKSLKGDGSAQ